MKELENFMNCDAFDFEPSKFVQPPELDDMAENVYLPALPRNILTILSATDEELADWEFSVKTAREEADEVQNDSDIEEMENELRKIKNSDKFIELKKQTSEKPNETPVVDGPVNVSEFLKVVMPPGVEDIVAKRDDEGNIISYEAIPRNEEEEIREFERLHLGLESDTEEEDAEDDPTDKMYEIDWEKEKVKIKSNKMLGGLQGNITETELNENFANIKEYLETCRSEEATAVGPEFEKHVENVNRMLDDLGFPRQRGIKEDNLQEFLDAQLENCIFILKANEDETCPPGNLITEVKAGDPDYLFETQLESTKSEEKTIIKRPSNLVMRITNASSDNEDDDNVTETPSPQVAKFNEPSETDELKPIQAANDDGMTRDIIEKINMEKALIKNNCSNYVEPQSDDLCNEFKDEYLKRGGTLEGLGETVVPDYGLKLETLESYSEKFLTFPYISEHSGFFNLVKLRSLLAQHYPQFSDEAFCDLSKACNLQPPELESSSDSDDSDDVQVIFKPDPFTTEDLMEKMPTNDNEDNSSDLPTADEDEEVDEDKLMTSAAVRNTSAQTGHTKKRKKRCYTSETLSSSESESEENSDFLDKVDTIVAQWAPFETKPIPSEEGIIENVEKLKEIVLVKNQKFKVPQKLKAWIDGNYEPSLDKITKWKQYFNEHYGDKLSSLTERVPLESLKDYESFMENMDQTNKTDSNPIVIFKKLLEEQIKENKCENSLSGSIADEGASHQSDICGLPAAEYVENKLLEENVTDLKSNIEDIPNEDEIELRKNEVNEREEEIEKRVEDLKINDDDLVHEDVADHTMTKTQEETEAPLPPKIPVLRLKDVPRPLRKEEWAEEVNSNAKIELVGTPAMSYPFELDGFQKHAIQALENGYNVFVSAHTSAGKTVVAEYAIAMSKRNRSKAVYTSPVKALSNQKYADFKRIFGSVGLITGDIQLNENAECLIMTTEILRSMLYNTSEKIRDLEFVVFDEVHYINDPERGHVWEEVLILLPPQVQIVMLSATVPNTLEFANWVGRTKQRKVMVCATHHRPVPLQHYVYTGTGGPSPGDTYLVKDGDGPFLVTEYGKAEMAMKANQEKERKNRKKQQMKRAEEEKEWKRGSMSKPKPFSNPSDSQEKRDQTLWISVVSFLQNRDWLPAVVFVFSRKKCDVFADRLKTIDLTTKSEKSFIHRFIKSQVEKLDDVDQDLPQIKVMQSQLLQGIGVHHSGILPIMKEIVEVLFQEGKVKLLFATETFAMGVNMPARTVLFHSIKKFDGTETRLLHPAEYIQMAGRAGRRGKDSAGNVIILAKPAELIARHDLETLMFGNPSKLISKFRLSYRMILNTLTMSGMLTVQSMMASSYCENQGQLKKKFVEKDLIEAEQFERTLKKKVGNDVSDIDVDYMTKFYTYAHAFINKWKDLRLQMIINGKILKDLQAGRLLKICTGQYINRTALLLDVMPHKEPSVRFVYKVMILNQDIQYTRDITSVGMEMDQEQLGEWYRLVSLMENLPSEKDVLCGPNDYVELVIKPQEIVAVCKDILKLQKNQIQEYLNQCCSRQGFRNKISEVGDKIASQLWASIGKTTEINETCQRFESFDLCLSVSEMWTLLEQLKNYPMRYNPLVLNSFKKVFRWKQAEEKVKILRQSLSDENMILYPDFKNKKALLKEKGYIDDSDTVQIKGYMAARVGKYELVVCELLVENILVNMEPEEVAALLSFLVCRSNNSDHYPTSFKTLTPSLQEGIKKCQKIIKDVILLEKQFQIEDYEGSETSKLSFGLVPIMYAWVKQEPFKKIMEMEELQEFEFQEGLLVRWIQQLLETLKEVEAAARVMGDPGVPTKLQAAGQRIKRGIVFAPSLYTTML
ncbi:superkiller complex protein 2 isoform X2 [Halyomorpha halys]|nr:helicase SKI2W-like isoform X2 [Halyomorpha halys]